MGIASFHMCLATNRDWFLLLLLFLPVFSGIFNDYFFRKQKHSMFFGNIQTLMILKDGCHVSGEIQVVCYPVNKENAWDSGMK